MKIVIYRSSLSSVSVFTKKGIFKEIFPAVTRLFNLVSHTLTSITFILTFNIIHWNYVAK